MSSLNLTDYTQIPWYTVTPGEYFVIFLILITTVCTALMTLLVLIKRNVPFIKAKQPALVLASGIGATFGQIGILQLVRVVPQAGAFLYNGGCSLFGIWFVFVIGQDLFVVSLIFRMARLYFIFNVRHAPTAFQEVLLFLALYSFPVIGHGIVGTSISVNGPITLPNGITTCYFVGGLYYANILYYAFLFVLFIYLCVSLRNVPKKAFSDYRMNLIIGVYYICMDIFYLIFFSTSAPSYVWGRCIGALIGCASFVVCLAVLMAKPLYHALVDPEEYLTVFQNEMNNVQYVHRAAQSSQLEIKSSSDQKISPKQSETTETEEKGTIIREVS